MNSRSLTVIYPVALYCALHLIPSWLGFSLSVTVILEALFWCGIALVLIFRGTYAEYGFSVPKRLSRPLPLILVLTVATNAVISGIDGTLTVTPILAFLFGALAEEIFFRVILSRILTEKSISQASAAVISSALFALLHLGGITDAGAATLIAGSFYAFGVGFGLCALTSRTESVIPAAILHLALNLSADGGIAVRAVTSAIFLISGIISILQNERNHNDEAIH